MTMSASASIVNKIAFIITLVGLIFNLIGFASPYWISYGWYRYNQGLWEACRNGVDCVQITPGESWFDATRTFAVFGFIAGVVAVVAFAMYMFVERFETNLFFMITMIANFVAAGCIFLAVVIYGSKLKNNLSWAFALSIIGFIVHLVAGVLMAVNKFMK